MTAKNNAKTETKNDTKGQVAEMPQDGKSSPASEAASKSPSLRTDTKIAVRTTTAHGKQKALAGILSSAELTGKVADGAIKAAARGEMFVAEGAYAVGIGNAAPSARALQHGIAVAALKAILEENNLPENAIVDLRAVQLKYVSMGGTDATIFTGKSRLYTNSTKSARVNGQASAPLTAYLPPESWAKKEIVAETPQEAVENQDAKAVAEVTKSSAA